MSKRPMNVTITIEKIEGVNDKDLALFIEDALSSWGGQFHPSNPLFDSLDVKKIKIRNTEYLFQDEPEE